MSNQNKNHKIAIIITTKHYKKFSGWTPVEPGWIFEGGMLHEEETGGRAFLKYMDSDPYGVYVVPCTNPDTADDKMRGRFLEELIEAVLNHGSYEFRNIYLFAHDKDFCPLGHRDELAEESNVSETIKLKSKLAQLIEDKHVWMFMHDNKSEVGRIISGINNKAINPEECKGMIDIIDENREMIDFFASIDQVDRYGEPKKGEENHE